MVEAENSTPDLSESSSMDDLRSALSAEGERPIAPWESEESIVEDFAPDPVAPPETNTTGSDTPAPDDAAAELSEDEIRRVLGHSRIQEQIKGHFQTQLREATARQIAEARALWEAEVLSKQEQEDEALLDDEEYGRRVREQQKVTPIIQRAQMAGRAAAQQEFFQNAVTSVWQTVPELQELPDAVKQELNPMNPAFRTYGDYINNIVDRVASARAEKLAVVKAKELADAQVASRLTEMRRSNPSPAGVSGPASGPGPIIDVSRMSGDELIRAALRTK